MDDWTDYGLIVFAVLALVLALMGIIYNCCALCALKGLTYAPFLCPHSRLGACHDMLWPEQTRCHRKV